ncbi:MAG: glutathione transferase GstA [Lysobacteraceae bacterium]
MKLYYSPGACSLAPHIVAHEAGIALELEKVDTKTKQTASGEDFTRISAKAYVPALVLDDGQVLTEGPVIAQYLADQRPQAGLAPEAGTLARYRLLETLGYINSEIHKNYSPLFNPANDQAIRDASIAALTRRYALIEDALSTSPWLLGGDFSIADAYLFVVTNWARIVKLDLSAFPSVRDFQERVAARPAVQAAMRAEGLIK